MAMAKIRKIEIKNFRSIKSLTWLPLPGVNCLIGPGDIGKSTILDAIDLCLGARRSISISDADFHSLDIGCAISITLTLGDLEDSLKSIEAYGIYFQAFNSETGEVLEEPKRGLETVLNLNLTINDDLEPEWSLVSGRATSQGLTKNIAWKDRVAIAPMRLGSYENSNFSWSKGSVLNRLSDQKIEAGELLAQVAREARNTFGAYTDEQLSSTLALVIKAANELGVEIGDAAKAMLDVRSVSFTNGAISLHDNNGVPLRNLGTGSSRLLIAGLNQNSINKTKIILVDEVEHGLEPHRLTRLLNALGSKSQDPVSQVFLTTHSPVALRELSGDQLYVVRRSSDEHVLTPIGISNQMQGAIRVYPESFLASTVIVCEGASEVGFIRGMDERRSESGKLSLSARGVSYVDAKGGSPDECLKKAMVYLTLGYKTIAFLDGDLEISGEILQEFQKAGGILVGWRDDRAIEDELFLSLTDDGVDLLIKYAIQFTDRTLVNNSLLENSDRKFSLESIEKITAENSGEYSEELRLILAKSSKMKKRGWFKTIGRMEIIAKDVIFPRLEISDPGFVDVIEKLFFEAHDKA